jgi:hypothetical protein
MEIFATLIGSPDRMKQLFVVYFFFQNSHLFPRTSCKISVLMQSLAISFNVVRIYDLTQLLYHKYLIGKVLNVLNYVSSLFYKVLYMLNS